MQRAGLTMLSTTGTCDLVERLMLDLSSAKQGGNHGPRLSPLVSEIEGWTQVLLHPIPAVHPGQAGLAHMGAPVAGVPDQGPCQTWETS